MGLKNIPVTRKPFILFAEDDATIVEVITMACSMARLGESDYKIVNDGRAAINFLERAASPAPEVPIPTRIVTDVRMPIVDGLELIAWVRANPQFKDLRISVISGAFTPSIEARLEKLGVSEVLPKPYVFSEFVRRLKNWADSEAEPDRPIERPHGPGTKKS